MSPKAAGQRASSPASAARNGRRSDPDWKETIAELRQRQRRLRQVAKTIGLDPDSPKAVILQDYLLSEVFRLAMEKRRITAAYLQRLQNLLKAAAADKKGKSKTKSPSDGPGLVQQLEQIYGPGVVIEELRDAP